MAKSKSGECCEANPLNPAGFKVESVITVDERGQMVLPKDLRAKAGIAPGEKLALVSFEQDGEVCCLCMLKTEALAGMVKQALGPMMTELRT